MNHSMFAALLFAMLSGMHPETPPQKDPAPQSTHQTVEAEHPSAAEPIAS